MGRKKHFRAWYITLPIAVLATVIFFDLIIENWTMMNSEDNPFAAIGILMIYAYYFGVAFIVAIVSWILTIIFVVKRI